MLAHTLAQPRAKPFLAKKLPMQIASFSQSIRIKQRATAFVERKNFFFISYIRHDSKRQSVRRDCLQISGRTRDEQRAMTCVRNNKTTPVEIRQHKLRRDEHVHARKL